MIVYIDFQRIKVWMEISFDELHLKTLNQNLYRHLSVRHAWINIIYESQYKYFIDFYRFQEG